MLYNRVLRTSWSYSNMLLKSKALHGGLRLYCTQMDPLIEPARIINQPAKTQFAISQRAANRLADIYKEGKEILKISVESGGCHGFQYNMKLVPETDIEQSLDIPKQGLELEKGKERKAEEADDFDDDFEAKKDVVFVLPGGHGKVVIDENSLRILNRTTLTYSTELIGSTFKISGGNMKSSCGCGSSFDVDAE